MKLYILRPLDEYITDNIHSLWENPYDRSFGFIIRAENENHAREIADENAGDENEIQPWLDSNYTSCIELTNEGESGLIMSDFVNG